MQCLSAGEVEGGRGVGVRCAVPIGAEDWLQPLRDRAGEMRKRIREGMLMVGSTGTCVRPTMRTMRVERSPA
jgi:hypothetical protein